MAEEDDDNLTRQTIGGLRWSVAATVATVVVQIGYTAVMGRLLEPELFGLVASAQVVLTFGSYFAEMGLGQALVQKAELVEDEVRAAFTSSVLLGVVVTGAIVLFAPAMATIFESPDVVPVARALALSLLLTAISLTGQHLLRRELRFKTIAIIDTAGTLIAYPLVGLGLAAAGAGVWSLVGAFLGHAVIKTVATLAVSRHSYRPLLAVRRLRTLYSFGGKVSLISVLEYFGEALVVVIIGRNAGQAALGQFNRAFLLVNLPLYYLNVQLAGVLFPTIAKVQGDQERVRRAYLQAVGLIAALLVPATAGMAVAAPQLVGTLLGDQWDTAARLLPALALAAGFSSLSTFGGVTAEALGALNTKMAVQGGYLVVLVGSLLLVPSDFVLGYVLVLAVCELLRLLAYAVFMGKLLAIPFSDHVAVFALPVMAAVVVSAGIWGVTVGLVALGLPVVVVLLAQIITGAVVLGLMATHGPLRRVRVDLRDRISAAYEGDTAAGTTAVVLRVLSIGDRPSHTSA